MIQEHIDWFDRYVRSFLTGDAEDDGHIELKREHSLHVLAEAQSITASLDMAPELVRAAHLGALFHDAGRFPQYRQYKTFKDSLSENHAFLGVRTLRGENVLGGLDPDMRGLVLGAVVLHNRRDMPGRISPELDLVARVVRDSDKLDIVRIMLDHMRPGGKRSDVVTLHVPDEPEFFTQEIVDQIMAGRIGDYALMRYWNDFKLLLLSWVHDLNFRTSRRAFLQRGHAQELFELLPRCSQLTALQDTIYSVLNR